ncbi:MAG: (2Fe-2S)-binding protein [Candidatus Riflebacteria bacterium]|nr:(2Fe-2S)-binding protein [Candidatus Riflebacteria bacterium]
MLLNMKLNGVQTALEIDPKEMLIDVLRSAGMKSVKKGCGEGTCGACAVLIDGAPKNSCITFAASCEGSEILTVEGMGNPEKLHPLQKAFVELGATQCGYCNPGSLIAAKSLLDHNPDPSELDVKEALDGNLCRCTGYVKRIEAVIAASHEMKKK